MDSVMKGILDQVPDASHINNYRTGDSNESFRRNTAGYSFVQRANRSATTLPQRSTTTCR